MGFVTKVKVVNMLSVIFASLAVVFATSPCHGRIYESEVLEKSAVEEVKTKGDEEVFGGIGGDEIEETERDQKVLQIICSFFGIMIVVSVIRKQRIFS